jgi:hypothetical protein
MRGDASEVWNVPMADGNVYVLMFVDVVNVNVCLVNVGMTKHHTIGKNNNSNNKRVWFKLSLKWSNKFTGHQNCKLNCLVSVGNLQTETEILV